MEEDHRVMIETWREMEADLKDAAEKLAGFAELLSRMSINYPLMRASEEFYASAFTSEEVVKRLNKIDIEYDDVMREILEEGNQDGSCIHSSCRIKSENPAIRLLRFRCVI